MNPRYLIWSDQHRMWWRAASSGYTPRLEEAGRYSRALAMQKVTDAMPGAAHNGGRLADLPVLEHDALEMQATYRAEYAALPREPWE